MSENPYRPLEIATAESPVGNSGWRYIPAAIFSLIGMLMFFAGIILAIGVFSSRATWDERYHPPIVIVYLGAAIWMVTGLGWIFAGTAFAFVKNRLGSYVALACLGLIVFWAFCLA